MKKRTVAAILALVLSLSMVLAGCSSSSDSDSDTTTEETTEEATETETAEETADTSSSEATEDNTLVIWDSDWEGIDMLQCTSWNDMQTLLADPVLGTDPDTLGATPGIASSSVWSDDGLTWTLTFPEGMYYSTGEQLEPEDFVASVEHGMEYSEFADGYANIESMEVDGRDVVIHFSSYQADTEYNFQSCFVGIIDKDELDTMSNDELLWGCHPYGAYYLVDYEPGAYVTLKANPGYVTNNPLVENQGACPIENIKIVFSGEDFTLAEGIKNGDYDILSTVPMAYYDDLEASEEVTVVSGSGAQLYYAELNLTDPLFEDINVRKALIKAINRDNITLYTTDELKAAYSLVLSNCLNYSEEAVEYYTENYDYDPEGAAELLAEAGWEDTDGDGILDKDGVSFSFTFDCRDTENPVAIASSIQLDLLEVGIDMQITTQDWSYVNQDVVDGNFQMAYLGLGWNEPFLLVDRFAQRNPEATNPDPEYQEELVAAARAIVDYDERTDAITEIQKVIMDYCTVIPLADETSYRCWRSEIEGIIQTSTGAFFLNDVVVDENGNFRS